MTIEGNQAEVRLWTIMRAVAAFLVMVYHFKNHVSFPLVSIPLVGQVIGNGDIGVDMFFVLSGFVMYYVYGGDVRRGRFGYRDFLVRRFARIYPVHLVTLLGALLLLVVGAQLGLATVSFSKVASSLPFQLLLLHGIGFGGAETLNYPSWSVSSEMFAYLLFPLFVWMHGFSKVPTWLNVLISLASLYWIADATDLDRFGALRVSVEFSLGLGLCKLLPSRWSLLAGPGLMVGGLLVFWASLSLEGPRSLAIVGLALTLFGAYVQDKKLTRSKLINGLVYLGQISYSTYMVHALVESPGFKLAEAITGSADDQSPVWVILPMIIVTLICAALLYHLVEQPSRRMIVRKWSARHGQSGARARYGSPADAQEPV